MIKLQLVDEKTGYSMQWTYGYNWDIPVLFIHKRIVKNSALISYSKEYISKVLRVSQDYLISMRQKSNLKGHNHYSNLSLRLASG